jgi:hypothetical protein
MDVWQFQNSLCVYVSLHIVKDWVNKMLFLDHKHYIQMIFHDYLF